MRVDSLGQLLRTNRIPIPETLLLGTGKRIVQPPPFIGTYLNNQGAQLDVTDTVSPMYFNCTLNYVCLFILDMTEKRVRDVQPPRGRRPTSRSGLITPRSTEKVEQGNCKADDGVSSDGRLKDGQGREIYFEFCLLKYGLL